MEVIMLLRVVLFTVWFLFVTLLFWSGGFNFDERGFTMVTWLYTAVPFGVLIASIPRSKS